MVIKYKRLNPEVICTKLHEESVLLNMKTGTYFGLDEVGTVIWERLELNNSFSEIIKYLVEHFNVDQKIVNKDITDFLTILKDNQILEE